MSLRCKADRLSCLLLLCCSLTPKFSCDSTSWHIRSKLLRTYYWKLQSSIILQSEETRVKMMKKATKKGKRSNLREKKERASQDQERRGIRTVTRRSKGGVTRCSEIDRFVNNFICGNDLHCTISMHCTMSIVQKETANPCPILGVISLGTRACSSKITHFHYLRSHTTGNTIGPLLYPYDLVS